MAEQRQLQEFFKLAPTTIEKTKKRESTEPITQPIEKKILKERIPKKEDPQQLPPSYFVSASYDGRRKAVCIKLYEPKTKRIYFWHDKTGHKPYLFTNLSPYELDQLESLKTSQSFEHFEVKRFNPLLGKTVTLTKIVAKDPLAIGGRATSLRELIPKEHAKVAKGEKPEAKIWEAAIKYYQRYIYDQDLVPGMLYSIKKGELVPTKVDAAENIVKEIQALFDDKEELKERSYIKRWASLLEYPAPPFRRVALDIEVFSPVATRVPDPNEAPYKIICASLMSTDNNNRILLLKRDGVRGGVKRIPKDTKVEFFDSEDDLIRAIFKVLWDYPFVITFNGDDFDLRYLAHRAEKLGIRKEIPIEVGRRVCLLKNGIHIDLYKFFYNRSIQIYAFSNKYRDVNLNDVGKALIGMSKIELDKPFVELSYSELAHYCLRDAEIAFKLTSFNNNLTMKLILVLARLSKMPLEDVSRQGVSRWIRNFLQFEHSRQGILVPNTSDILALKGDTATTAIIKGKKYKGAIVVEPEPGVHFNVAVMDFASLYPSIIKIWNLGYQTIRCSHEECKSNVVPGTPHWVCRQNKALESLVIGSLRDLRVRWYKPKIKDTTLPINIRSWYNVIQRALKVILNASYGVFGAESFDLYCPPVAEATAAIARYALTQIVEKAKTLNIEVLYGDTDSVFLKNPSKDQIKELARWSKRELKMTLDVDKVYRYTVFSSRKKNYLGVLEDGSVDVKGLTGKKRHIPKFIKNAFDEMKTRLGSVNSSAEFEIAKKDIKKIILDRYTRLKRRGWINLNDLAFHVVLGAAPERYDKTTPQHVTAARILQDKGFEMKAGDLVSFVKIKRKEYLYEKPDMKKDQKKVETYVMPIQFATDSEIDVEKYVAYLRSTFEQVLDALGLEFDEIIGLTKLERFM
ncbi:MAG: DNA-directed DNA polymerase I [Candidatus Bathyarchaeota archaeon]|nr:MAG: DNA-directed DNA polymerase I [Candidatus Bathyarchaeota archaeon]